MTQVTNVVIDLVINHALAAQDTSLLPAWPGM